MGHPAESMGTTDFRLPKNLYAANVPAFKCLKIHKLYLFQQKIFTGKLKMK
jgi:hypothetical protein